MVAKSCSRSHGQPPSGSRSFAMMASRRVMSRGVSDASLMHLLVISAKPGQSRLSRVCPPRRSGIRGCLNATGNPALAGNGGSAPFPPGQRGIAEGEEIAVQQRIALVVAERTALRVEHRATGRLEDGLPGGGVPFAGRAKAGIEVHRA